MSVINSVKERISWEANIPSVVKILPYFRVTHNFTFAHKSTLLDLTLSLLNPVRTSHII
jgi:hypothetical protein